MVNDIENLIRLPKKEEDKFAEFIRNYRRKLISSPKIQLRKLLSIIVILY